MSNVSVLLGSCCFLKEKKKISLSTEGMIGERVGLCDKEVSEI